MDNKLLNNLKSLLLKQNMSIDEDELLQDIFAELPPEKKKNRLLFIFLAIGFFSVIAASIYHTKNDSVSSNPPIVIDHQLSNNKATQKEVINNTELVTKMSHDAVLISDQAFLSEESKIESKSIRNSIDELITIKASNNHLHKPNTEIQSPESRSDSQITNTHSYKDSKSKNVETSYSLRENNTQEASLQNDLKTQLLITQDEISSLSSLNSRAILWLPVAHKDFSTPELAALNKRTANHLSNIHIEINVQGHYQDHNLKNTQSRPSYQLQTLIKYDIGKVSPLIGLSFKRINSVLDHTWSEERNILDIDEATIFCPDDPIDCLTFNNLIQTTRHVSYNNIDIINIPIGIEYQSSGKTSWWTRALVNIPISSAYKFEYLNANDDIIDLRNIENANVQTSVEIQLSMGLAHRVFRNTDLRIGLQHDYSTKNISISNAPLSLPKSNFGGQIGLSYWLN